MSVTKDCHNPIFASQVFSLTSVWQFASCNFLFYEALELILLTTSFINSVVCWSSKMVTTLFSHRKFFCWHPFHSSLLAISRILFCEALRRIILLTILFINSDVCWSQKIVTILYLDRKFFRWHVSEKSLLATSWNLLYEALKLILPTTSFFNGVVCWSTKMVTVLSSRCKFFRWRLSGNSLLETSWILFHEVLRRILLLTT